MKTQFSQWIGNANTIQAITQLLQQRRMPAAIILEGPVHSGRKNLAHIIGAALLCEEGIPCGECNSCRKVFFTGHPDVSVVLPEKGKANISVEQIRTVRSDAFVRPVEGKAKIYILAGSMNLAAQNALLKVLEEPPAGVYFLLICEHRNELLETVLSRATAFSLEGASDQEGGLREQAEKITLALAGALAAGSRKDFLVAAVPAGEDRLLQPLVMDGLYRTLHGALTKLAGVPEGETVYGEVAGLLARRFSPTRLAEMAKIVTAMQKKINYNVNGNLFFTALCSELLPRT